MPENRGPWCEMHEDKITRIFNAVFGNGKPGLTSRMDKLESKLETGVAILKWQLGILVSFCLVFMGWMLSQVNL